MLLKGPRVVEREICRKKVFYLSRKLNFAFSISSMLLVQTRVLLIRMAYYGTSAKTLGQVDVMIE